MLEQNNTILTFLDRLLDVPEAKVTYLTRVTFIDRVIEKLFLRFIPDHVTPNQITKFRLFTIPFIGLLLLLDLYAAATILFLFAAFSDALDGALARTKRQITTWGTLYDPIADKLLIGIVAIIIVSKYIGIYLAVAIVVSELALISSAYYRYKGRIVPAKTMGKLKMILQCVGVILLLLAIVFQMPVFVVWATYTLYISLVFSALSLLVFRSI